MYDLREDCQTAERLLASSRHLSLVYDKAARR